MCCPLSDERVCAIKAKPLVVRSTIRLIHDIMVASQATIKAPLQAHKPYDALNFDMSLVDKYGGYVPDDCSPAELEQLKVAGVGCFVGSLASSHQHPIGPNQSPHHQHPHHNLSHARLPSLVPQPADGQQQSQPQLAHYDLMGPAEPAPFIMPSVFRPAGFLAPAAFQPVDFVPFHPLGEFLPAVP
jgi:hypothetical protein